MKRIANLNRKTTETDIFIELNLDGTGKYSINTGIKLFDHMLSLLAKHSGIDLVINGTGDLMHHLIEDVAITLGESFLTALGDKVGITRYGFSYIPMDDSLARCVVDFSGRKAVNLNLNLSECEIENVAIDDLIHFFDSFAENSKINLHMEVLYGKDQHHKLEACFKALAVAIKQAISISSKEIPSTKGKL